MEYYSTKTPSSHRLLKMMFYIIFTITITSLILFFTLKVNVTANSNNGEIIAENTAVQYLAPMESQINKVFVKEGDLVQAGDTLLILKNEQLNEEIKRTTSELNSTKSNLVFFQKQLANFEKKINRQKKGRNIIQNQHSNRATGNDYEIRKIKQQLDILENKFRISENRLNNDKQLLQKGAISKKEYDKRYQEYLDETNALNQAKNDVQQQTSQQGNLKTDLAESLNNHDLNILNLESNKLNQQKQLEQEISREEQLMATLNSLNEQLSRLNIIAKKEGHVANLFNARNDVNLLPKNQTILYISPISGETFYAKLLVSEDELKDIKPGQPVHIKLKAYNHYQYGIIRAEVHHVDKQIVEKASDTGKGQFYVLAQIPGEEAEKIDLKNGFKVSAEIILNEVKLSRYVFNSMFKKLNT